MAGLDYMYDACGLIEIYIRDTIRELLERFTNEYQDSNWVQAAELFRRTVVPCEEYLKDHFLELAADIIEKAKINNNKVVYKPIPGMYNQKVLKEEENSAGSKVEVIDYENLIQEIKDWVELEEL
jgi:hypothetical protein